MTTPCPFCSEPDPVIDEIQPGVFAAVCPGCNAIGPHTFDRRHSSPELAARQWDERARSVAKRPSCADCRHSIVVAVEPPKNEEMYCLSPKGLRGSTLGEFWTCRENRLCDDPPGVCGFDGAHFERKA